MGRTRTGFSPGDSKTHGEKTLQHHGESGLHSRPSSRLENGKYENLSCEKPRLYSRKSWQIKSYGAVKCHLEMPFCTLPELVDKQKHFLLLLPECGNIATLVLEVLIIANILKQLLNLQ